MRLPFLSDAWFDANDVVLGKAGNPRPKKTDGIVNLTVQTAGGPIEAALQNGMFLGGHQPKAAVTLTMPADIAFSFCIESDPSAIMQGIYAGSVILDGDPAGIAAGKRNAALQQCFDSIVAQTAPPEGGMPSAAEKAARYEIAAANLTVEMKADSRKATAKKVPATKPVARLAAATKPAATNPGAKEAPAKKSPAKKSAAKKSPQKKSPAKKSPAKKSPAKKSAAKKSPQKAKRSPTKNR